MPKKGQTVIRTSQPSTAILTSFSTQSTHAPPMSRKAAVTFQTQEGGENEMEIDEDEAGGEDEVEDDTMAEMLTMLQEFQKRKATKSTARSAAFQNEKAALFTAARKKVESAVRVGNVSIEKARTAIADLRAEELSPEATLSKVRSLQEGHEECMQSLLGHLTGVIEDLSHRRAAQINDSSATLEAHAGTRERSRRRLCAYAHSRVSKIIERQKTAADATALIKNYKALLMR